MTAANDITVIAPLATGRALVLFGGMALATLGTLSWPIWVGGPTVFFASDNFAPRWAIAALASIALLWFVIRNVSRMMRHPGAGIWASDIALFGISLTRPIPLRDISHVSVASWLGGPKLVFDLKDGRQKSLPLALYVGDPEEIAASIGRHAREAASLS